MTEQYRHPMRSVEIHTFSRSGPSETGAAWRAQFYPYDTYPLVFNGNTEADVIARAETFRDEVVATNEAAYITRRENSAKATAAALAKRMAKK